MRYRVLPLAAGLLTTSASVYGHGPQQPIVFHRVRQVEDHALRIDVGDLQMCQFGPSHSGGVTGLSESFLARNRWAMYSRICSGPSWSGARLK